MKSLAAGLPRPAAARSRALVGALALLALALGPGAGCRKQKTPEHVVQLQHQEQEEVARRAAQARARPDLGVDERSGWPLPVQEAYLALRRASFHETPRASQLLAYFGQQAVPALREIARGKDLTKEKRAAASFLLVEVNLARPAELSKLAREASLPLVQRAAIEALLRIGNVQTKAVIASLRGEQGSESGELLPFLEQAARRTRPWGYADEQLLVLDRILQARTPVEVQVALGWVQDLSLDRGLTVLAGSPAVPPPLQVAIAARVVAVAGKARALPRLLEPERPPLLRQAAATAMMTSKDPAARHALERVAASRKDPMAPWLKAQLGKK